MKIKVTDIDSVVPVTFSGTSRTLSSTDMGGYLMSLSTAPVVLTVPVDADADIDVGATVVLEQNNVGAVTVTPASGVAVNSRAGYYSTAGQYAVIQLKKVSANTWTLIGDVGE